MIDELNLSIIVAMGENRVIGKRDDLPDWDLRSDLRRFARLTKKHIVIVGRKTHEAILKRLGHPLSDRTTVVVTRQEDYESEGCIVVHSWEEALERAHGQGEVFAIGGAEIYRLALLLAKKMYITTVEGAFEGDVFFPEFDQEQWQRTTFEIVAASIEDSHSYEFEVFRRVGNPDSFVELKHAREEEQHEAMERIMGRGECPFCRENLEKEHKEPIIWEGTHWLVTRNQWPYRNTRFHLLVISKIHAEKLEDLPLDAGAELFKACRWVERTYNIRGGGLGIGMRFGDPRFNRGTVKHLHAQILVADITDENDPNYTPVRFRIS